MKRIDAQGKTWIRYYAAFEIIDKSATNPTGLVQITRFEQNKDKVLKSFRGFMKSNKNNRSVMRSFVTKETWFIREAKQVETAIQPTNS